MPIGLESVKGVKIVQNVTGGQLTIPDLGKRGCYLDVDEVVDLQKFFKQKEIDESRDLARALKNGMVVDLTDGKKAPISTKRVDPVEAASTPDGDSKVAPANVFDEKYKEMKEKDKKEDLETRASER